jgi:ketosteroid isomerase-like protein
VHIGDEGRNVQLVRQFFATLSTGDLEALRPLLHPQGSWEVMATTVPGAGRTNGGDAVIDQFLAPVRGLFAPGDPKVEVKRAFSVGDLVCAETEATGELTNGNHYHNRYAWVIEIRDDVVCHLREYMDTAYIESVLG